MSFVYRSVWNGKNLSQTRTHPSYKPTPAWSVMSSSSTKRWARRVSVVTRMDLSLSIFNIKQWRAYTRPGGEGSQIFPDEEIWWEARREALVSPLDPDPDPDKVQKVEYPCHIISSSSTKDSLTALSSIPPKTRPRLRQIRGLAHLRICSTTRTCTMVSRVTITGVVTGIAEEWRRMMSTSE